ncbi:hypothetical protein KIH39_13435 [Telmatocola sphagniphila]|uniref:Uncharacterized protein n=1 Tax=Telmatocola sphagniphila TaxID=1123043 RepID=A0A8E6EVV9_9BACT|nr:hypothetical protein [Telmatocola sphagniphila]QVL29873.1 hypothetical protein KIH39_13435 [Telmatocola sphagniphila]
MMRSKLWVLGLLLSLFGASLVYADDKSGLNEEGFLQRWVVLAPIPLADGQGGEDGLMKEQLKDEAKLQPKAGDKVKVGDTELLWKNYIAKDHLLDLNDFVGKQTEDSVAYAVAYIESPEDLKNIKMKTGSDDQSKVYLNGKEVFKFTQERATDKDQDTTEVSLKKGTNVLVVKVVNVKVDWSFCVRFTDKDDKPITKLTVK